MLSLTFVHSLLQTLLLALSASGRDGAAAHTIPYQAGYERSAEYEYVRLLYQCLSEGISGGQHIAVPTITIPRVIPNAPAPEPPAHAHGIAFLTHYPISSTFSVFTIAAQACNGTCCARFSGRHRSMAVSTIAGIVDIFPPHPYRLVGNALHAPRYSTKIRKIFTVRKSKDHYNRFILSFSRPPDDDYNSLSMCLFLLS